VARRKIVLVFLFLLFMALLLSPWASAPTSMPGTSGTQTMQQTQPANEFEEMPDTLPQQTVDLHVTVALEADEFAALLKQNEEQAYKFRDIRISLTRLDPQDALRVLRHASRIGKSSDVMLMNQEWVKSFAVSGYLSPADGAFTGDALSEQFDALTSQLRWNGYLWGVPRDFDPLVLVWNLPALQTLADGADLEPPLQSLQQWEALATGGKLSEPPLYWLALGSQDPLALLYWLQAASGETTEMLVAAAAAEADPWSGSAAGEALALLDQERAGVLFAADPAELAASLTEGRAVSAIVPHSLARRLISEQASDRNALSVDYAAWKMPFVWPRARSFTISSHTEQGEAAQRWIAAMTDAQIQEAIWPDSGKLPVYQSLYRSNFQPALRSLFPPSAASSFPHLPLPDFDPGLADRLSGLGRWWQKFAAGPTDTEYWLAQWRRYLADPELHD